MHSHHVRGGDPFEQEGGRRRERVFPPGAIRLLALSILASQPCHGYEVIRAIGALVGGDYSPSPGTIYPTLALLEDMGLATASVLDDGRKQYRITPAGQQHLDAHAEDLERVRRRLAQERPARPPQLQRAIENFRAALRLRLEADRDAATLERLIAIIDRAAVDIGRA
ncbi:PadR family transcriptional regulator [Bordetella avium]|uniref:PadR family transcriptional regulator n=1 Tax=Bordetella avium TaxID=521 RepID=UPI000E09E84D|nr:PadR family transcriptional regulator [Bordetella avium]RIQ12351.1 PadR family transcriptional regulator [Bordetella avium]RIQ36069.1 PadR family transcriptional regulator [Bordetella avium]RIQ40102.1 PadR family transcriptional regulator [Bordetella avium]RIQ41734.1 PadR family transcriptional regulator [Bordetella avium]RIQ47420.1 PadR family transcriptional regulator [Bordetella avium]